MPYPTKMRDKVDWWVVIKTKPRSRVDNSYTLELAYQKEMMCNVSVTANDVPLENMRDDSGHLEEDVKEDSQEEDEEEDIEEEDEYEDEEQEKDNVEFSIKEDDDD